MVNKLLVFLALSGLAFGCDVEHGVETHVGAFDPAQALVFFRGFIYGLQDDYCHASYCYTNSSSFFTEIESAVTIIDGLITNFNIAQIPDILCNFNGIYDFYIQFVSNCDFDAIIYAIKQLADSQQFVAAIRRVTYNLYVYDYAWTQFQTCESNYGYCGGAAGSAFKTLIGYGIPANPHTEPFGTPEIDLEFVGGFVEGYGPAATLMIEKAYAVVNSFIATREEGPNNVYDFIEHYKEAKEAWETLNLPNMSQIAERATENYLTLGTKMYAIQTAESPKEIGKIVGESLKLLAN